MKKYVVRLCTAIIVLTAIDQLVKYIINMFFFQTVVTIIPGILTFRPVHNTDLSWFGSLGLQIFANYYVTVIFNLLIFSLAIILYRYLYVNMGVSGKLTQIIFIFLFAAILCSTIDRIFWTGSIDYIRLKGFFTFDIKDCYMTAFIILFIGSYFKYQKEWNRFSVKELIKALTGEADSSQ